MRDRTPEAVVWNLFWGALATRALGLVSDLRIADALAAGPRPIADLAREVDADSDALHRILRALASEGVFAEERRGVFRNTEASDLLRRSGMDDFAHLFGTAWHRTAGELDATGSPVFAKAFGSDFWTWLAEHPSERGAFDRAMAQSVEWKLERLERVAWRGDKTVVDIGGGNGAVLVELVRRHTGLRGIVFDLPETIRDEATFGDRCTFVAGDFFESVPRGDAYVLSTILHDWDDERSGAILRTIRAAAAKDARLIIMDAVIPAGNERHGAKWLDLLMLVLFAGRERDQEQWRQLLGSADFEPVQIEDGLIQARAIDHADTPRLGGRVMHRVRAAGSGDIDECARVLAAAFHADPGTIVYLPDDGERSEILPQFFRTFVAAGLSEDADIAVSGDPISGVASWFGPERHAPSEEAMGAHGLGAVLERSGPHGTGRLVAMLHEIEGAHERLATEPHLRLEFFGVSPDLQGTGIGTALIEHGHRRADDLGIACYLETFTEPNVRYYERRGYHVVGELTIGDGVRGWGMLRPAALDR